MNEWISVEDRLPELETNVLVITKYNDIYIAFPNKFKDKLYWDIVCGCQEGSWTQDVTHWQPLPARPNE